MKYLALVFVRMFAHNRKFRIEVAKELHRHAQTATGEQNLYGRFYESCGEFFEAMPTLLINSVVPIEEGVKEEFIKVRDRLQKEANTKEIDKL